MYNRARYLVNCDEKGPFSLEEDNKIIEFMSQNRSDRPFEELSMILNRRPTTIRHRYKIYLKHNIPFKSGSFSFEESCQILETVLENSDKNVIDVCKDLEIVLKRHYLSIQHHYVYKLKPLIVMYENGTLDVDYRKIIYQYFVDNNIKFLQDADFSALIK